MQKRRVGVTARSRQIVGRQATESPQIVTEMAAPFELRTPKGTFGERRLSADGSMATKARDQRAEASPKAEEGEREMEGVYKEAARLNGAHEARPHTPPRGKPPETPGPLSLGLNYPEGRETVKGPQAAQKARP
jgi:hypothetical protein